MPTITPVLDKSLSPIPESVWDWQTSSTNGMQYMVLLPAGYDPSVKYPATLYLHQLDNGSNGPEPLQGQINAWFNTPAFRSAHPSIIVAPLLDQNADLSGQAINFGGVSTADTAGKTNAIAALKQVMQQYSVDPARVYVTGNSMGGIGTWDMLIKFNAYTGTEGKIFAAGMPLAGAYYSQDFPNPPASIVQALKNVPIWAIHGAGDTEVALTWDRNMYAAEQAVGGLMKYTEDASLGHDVWDSYYIQAASWDWLYGQKMTGDINQLPPSADNTVITTVGSAIVDANGNSPTLTSSVVTPDKLSITLSGEAYQGSPLFIAKIDGQALTAAPTMVTAAHGTDIQTFDFHGNWGGGSHDVETGFVNDLYGGTADTDRNLYVEQVSYNGYGAMPQVQPLFSEGLVQITVP